MAARAVVLAADPAAFGHSCNSFLKFYVKITNYGAGSQEKIWKLHWNDSQVFLAPRGSFCVKAYILNGRFVIFFYIQEDQEI